MTNFTHLHLHTEYSVLDGINRVETLPEHIKKLGQSACAITDHGTLSGTYKFYKACKKAGIKPILGMEAYYSVIDKSIRENDDLDQRYYHLVLLAKNNNGLKNLFAISSKAYSEGMYHKPRCDDALLAEYSKDIIATSACLGSRAAQLILNNQSDLAEKYIQHHAAIFKDNFLIEIQLHKDREQIVVNEELVRIAKKHSLPIVVVNDCHYTSPDDKDLHEQALCMQTNDLMSNEDRFSFGPIDVHVASAEFMLENIRLLRLPEEAISNTQYVTNLIEVDYFCDTWNKYPVFPDIPENETSFSYLENKVKDALEEKFGGIPPKEYQDRINYELKTIKKMGFDNYILIIDSLVSLARENNILVGPGRGSAGGSLVTYALGITQLDPIKYNLLFERFLNYGRAAIPKIF